MNNNNIYIRSSSPQWPPQTPPQFGFPTNPINFSSYRNNEQVFALIKKLTMSPSERSDALHALSVQREQIQDLGVLLWESPGTMTALLSEILSIYPHLAVMSQSSNSVPPTLNNKLATRVCHVLALFQCVAGHEKTRKPFINANMPMYLFPFLHSVNHSRECEFFKLTSLGIIGSLVKVEQSDIIEYLLQNEFMPLCLRILKFGQEMSRIVAAFIIQKILSDKVGRNYVCQLTSRIEILLKVLNGTIQNLMVTFNQRLSKNIVLAYQYLLEEPQVKDVVSKMDLSAFNQQSNWSQLCDSEFIGLLRRLSEFQRN